MTASHSKLYSHSSSLDPALDRANQTSLWRNPEVGKIYRNTEHITRTIIPPLIKACGLTDEVIASLERPIQVLDMCCGTGVASAYIQTMLQKADMASKGMIK
ncbi:uncharacterized protein ColSpa_10342 [Colletotrichum spaethianum]|uniref:Methyltransferase domain-containing protein n=1 Tax=Colletotrichum spaethianum TaxID=700344 RepID=A0AA37UKJ4_9PEZI|nr:uncharacterized protein ColSpa_10342 [Colletotrichum spaethianum]GKT50161.1 hypothetical protein ColSpa_10342 [Colletotrichum spaethianum]